MSDPQTRLEERLSELIAVVDDLSSIVARQDKEITQLRERLTLLMQREAEREAAAGGSVIFSGQERPPHY